MLHHIDMASDGPVVFASFPQAHFHHRQDHIQSPHSQTWMPSSPTAPASAAAPARPTRPSFTSNPSRKRSREEFDDLNLETLQRPDNGGLANMDVVDEPIFGEGMTLIDPTTGHSLAAESQTGTWYEENLEAERRAAADAAAALEQEKLEAKGRPSKTVRLDSPAPGMTEIQQPLATTPAPAIDNASMMLGVGWKEVAADPGLAQAARGWARYIENHYPVLSGVEILCTSEGHAAVLAKAAQPQESYWLLPDNLSEARLVSTSQDGCIRNLRTQPMVFDNDAILTAVSSPAHLTPASAAPTPLDAPAGELVAAGAADHMMFD